MRVLKGMFNILSHQGNVNQKESEIPSYICQKGQDDTSDIEDVGQRECFSSAGGSTYLYRHFGNQYGGFSKNWESINLKT